jgi:predicted DCC family thiol-disulfide oxidoreductase YuxK
MRPVAADVELEVFFDGGCPLCRREIGFLRYCDRKQRLHFHDIDAADFDAAKSGKSYHDLMGQLHARLPNGDWLVGVEVFRRMYGAVGLRWLIPVTRVPGLAHLLDWAYALFARNRLRLTGRCSAGRCTTHLHCKAGQASN